MNKGDKAEALRNSKTVPMELLVPHLMSIHPMRADLPDEETFLMNSQLPLFSNTPLNGVLEYMNELTVTDGPMAPVYRTLNRWLELMAATHATPEHATLVFKSPLHMMFIDDLVASLDGEGPVVFLRTKRDDLVKVMASFLSLIRAQQELFFERIDLDYIEDQLITPKSGLSFPELIVRQYRRMNKINATTHHTVIDVDFEDIVSNPVGVIKALDRRASCRERV